MHQYKTPPQLSTKYKDKIMSALPLDLLQHPFPLRQDHSINISFIKHFFPAGEIDNTAQCKQVGGNYPQLAYSTHIQIVCVLSIILA